MPAAQSEETMHLFIDFLAEGRICQTVCACVCACAPEHLYIVWQRHIGGKKEESDSGLKRDEERRRARQEVHPWEPTHPLFVPVLSLMHWRVDMKHRATAKNEEKKKAAKNVGQLSKQLRRILKIWHRLFIFCVCDRRSWSSCFVTSQRALMPRCKPSQTTDNSPRSILAPLSETTVFCLLLNTSCGRSNIAFVLAGSLLRRRRQQKEG